MLPRHYIEVRSSFTPRPFNFREIHARNPLGRGSGGSQNRSGHYGEETQMMDKSKLIVLS
jgi:hypothetical protein